MANTSSPLLPSTDSLLQELGERLRLARLRRRLQSKQVAERAGMSVITLRKIERGDAGVTIGAYVNVLQVLQLQSDLSKIGAEDPLGRRLQDIEGEGGMRVRRIAIDAHNRLRATSSDLNKNTVDGPITRRLETVGPESGKHDSRSINAVSRLKATSDRSHKKQSLPKMPVETSTRKENNVKEVASTGSVISAEDLLGLLSLDDKSMPKGKG